MTAPNDTPRWQHSPDPRLNDAVAYALQVPGKQLRSKLTQSIAAMLTADAGALGAAAQSVGEAIELLHTYSLIHDDLPAMDNDDLRRGRPTLHCAFDEATAILVGDGLQALAFERIANVASLPAETRLELVRVLSQAVGLRGMVGGQAMDLAAEGVALSREDLGTVHALKTGALIEAAVDAGALCAAADETVRLHLRGFAQQLGLAFQVIDDVLDATASSSVLGKTAGKDSAAQKSTYVLHLGVEGARNEAIRLLNEALQHLQPWGKKADPVADIARKMVMREA